MTCKCGCEFCWLCMKEISDLHYLSPSGCTFWGKEIWSKKKIIIWVRSGEKIKFFFKVFLAMWYSGLCFTSDRNRRSSLDTFVCFRATFLCCKNGAQQNEEKNYIASKTESINSGRSDRNILSFSYCCWYIR